jgi:ribonucleoside-diphosphate reductase alpha chain
MRQIAEDVLRERYYQPGETCWDDVSLRVANYIGNDEVTREEYYQAIAGLEIIPNSPALMNAGVDNGGSLSACFGIPVYDSIPEIFDAIKSCAIIHSRGGGTGMSMSRVRAKDSLVNGTGKRASGPVSFLHAFNAATETIKAGGSRRGANSATLEVNHPDIKEFINCKKNEGTLSNFNISVRITDEFMRNPDPEVWDMIVDGNWRNGEPGVIFCDTAERDNKRPELGKLTESNPCFETCLLPWESCNLASINLMRCFIDGKFNIVKFTSLVRLGVRFLNDMIDKNRYPLPQIEEATKKTRKIGLGVMGFADLLIALGMRYGDEDSLKFADKLFRDMREVADDESQSIGGNNAALLSLAPTGTISLFAGVSSGIEPNFGYVYNRSTWASGEKTTYREVHPMFEEAIKDHAWKDSIIRDMEENGSVQSRGKYSGMDCFVTAKDISPMDHVRMQATIQMHVDQAISKSINCAYETTKEEISDLIKFAWESGCKGLTIYREGSRSDVVLETNATKKTDEKKPDKKEPVTIPREIDLKSIRMNSACGILWVKTGFLHGCSDPIEVWVDAEKGGCRANLEFIGRLVSKMLQEGINYEVACKQGDKVFCSACVNNVKNESEGYSCANLISKGIKEGIKKREEDLKTSNSIVNAWNNEVKEFTGTLIGYDICPDCGAKLNRIEGCFTCSSCGYSRCK